MAHNNKHMRHVWADAEEAEAVTGHGPDDRWWGGRGAGGSSRPRAGQRPFLFAVLTWFKCLRERVPSPPPLALRLFTFNDSQTNHRERGGLGLQHVPRCVCVMCVCAGVLLKCFQISRISGQQRQQNDAGSLLTFRRLFVRQIVQRFSSSFFFFVVFLLFLAFHLRHRQTRHINELWSLHRVQCMKCILSLVGIMRRNYRQRGEGGQMWGRQLHQPCHMRSSLSLSACLSLSWFCIYPWK